MHSGCYEPGQRARDMLADGILGSVLFPTLPRFAGTLFLGFRDKVLAGLSVQAYNDFVIDEWCPSGPPGLFADDHLPAVGSRGGRRRDPPVRRQRGQGAFVPRE